MARHYGAIVGFVGYDPRSVGYALPGRLNAIRRRLGLTQADFAAKGGLDEGSVCRWENGSRGRPSRWMAVRVAAILANLEAATASPAEATDVIRAPEPQSLTYFDRMRWRRHPPPSLVEGAPNGLGDRLRHRRFELGLSQEEAGKLLGVGRVTVFRWERGGCRPPDT